MQVIGIVGYVDKYDFILNLAKTINIMDKAVLVVDATIDKKMKCVVPSLDNIGDQYITQYNNIDFALGFNSMNDIENYMCEQSINIGLYDYIIIDIDSPRTYEFFRSRNFDRIYFFTDSSLLSVNKNKEIVKAIKVYDQEEKVNITKVIYKSYLTRASEEYFEKQIEEYKLEFNEKTYEIPNDDQDKMVNIDSQFGNIINLKKHTKSFVNSVTEIASEILLEISQKEIKNQIKRRKE